MLRNLLIFLFLVNISGFIKNFQINCKTLKIIKRIKTYEQSKIYLEIRNKNSSNYNNNLNN